MYSCTKLLSPHLKCFILYRRDSAIVSREQISEFEKTVGVINCIFLTIAINFRIFRKANFSEKLPACASKSICQKNLGRFSPNFVSNIKVY